MTLIKCTECGKEISDTAKICPHCGYNKKTQPHTKIDKIFIPIMSITIMFGIIGLVMCPSLVKYTYPNSKIVTNGESQYTYEKTEGSSIATPKSNSNYKSSYSLGEREADYTKTIIVGCLSVIVPTTTIIIYKSLKKKEVNK